MISIIIPVYKRLPLLQKVLDALFRQTEPDFEVIIVDDGNIDPLDIKNFTTPRNTKLIRQPHAGANVARNTGAASASGQYLLFLDADTVLLPKALEIFKKTLEQHQNVSYAYSAFKFSFKTFRLWPYNPKKLQTMPYIHTTSLMRREHFPGFDPRIKRLQDWDLWLTMLEENHYGVYIPEILFKVKTGGTMSAWRPSFLYKFPWLPAVKKYQAAVEIVKRKHHLN